MIQTPAQRMAKKKPEQDQENGESGKTTTKVATELLRKARTLAADKNMDIYDYLDSLLRPGISRDWKDLIRRAAQDEETEA